MAKAHTRPQGRHVRKTNRPSEGKMKQEHMTLQVCGDRKYERRGRDMVGDENIGWIPRRQRHQK